MKLLKLLLILLLTTLATYGAIAYLLVKVAGEIDNNGGLKTVVERVWNGKEAK